jgi:hypothetical protein
VKVLPKLLVTCYFGGLAFLCTWVPWVRPNSFPPPLIWLNAGYHWIWYFKDVAPDRAFRINYEKVGLEITALTAAFLALFFLLRTITTLRQEGPPC